MADIKETVIKTDVLIRKKAVWTFAIFFIVITKDILVAGLRLIPERSPLNWQISYFFIMPIMILGLVLSLQVVCYFFSTRTNRKYRYLLLASPTMMCWLYAIVVLFKDVIYSL